MEGASVDELLELEARYAIDGSQLETGRGEILQSLPEAINDAVLGQYPDAVIGEIAPDFSISLERAQISDPVACRIGGSSALRDQSWTTT